ncbi:hypothetical protein D3C86_2115480 [compost metagenome]
MMQHLAGTNHAAHQKQCVCILNARRFERFNGTNQQIALTFENLQHSCLVILRHNSAAQLNIYMHNRSSQNILMAVLQLIAKLA